MERGAITKKKQRLRGTAQGANVMRRPGGIGEHQRLGSEEDRYLLGAWALGNSESRRTSRVRQHSTLW